MDDLLRSISWHAEKQFRRRGGFPSVLWLAENTEGRRNMFEVGCAYAPKTKTDAEVLTGLATDAALEFSEASPRITRFVVAYAAHRVKTFQPLDPDATMKPKTERRRGIVLELHAADEHVGLFREIIRLSGRAPMLGPVETYDEPFTSSPYANVLARADKWRDEAAKAKAAAKVKAQVAAQVATKAKVVAQEASVWPPQFLLNSPRRPIQPA